MLLVLIALVFVSCGGNSDSGDDADAGDTVTGDGDAVDDFDPDDGEETDLPPAPIVILIDTMGIPHIYADTDEHAFFGAGYITARDRLYQMAMLRRFALGRLSEVLGEEGLLRDMMARTFDFPRWGREDYEHTQIVDPERAALISAWVAGINRHIEEIQSGEAPLPFGYREEDHDFMPELWDEADPYIVLKGAGFANDKTIEFEVALTLLYRLYAERMSHVQLFKPAHPYFGVPAEDRPESGDYPIVADPAAPAPAMPEEIDEEAYRKSFEKLSALIDAMPGPMGSNNWAVHGRFTENGRPLIVGDPHLGFDFFGAPYPMHINSRDSGGTYNTAGFAYPGTPGIALGFNDTVIWVVTTNMGDVNDLWKVTKLFGILRIGGERVDFETREEEIIVREAGQPVGEGRVETMTYEDVPGYGVLVPSEIIDIPASGILLGTILTNWAGFKPRAARWFMELNRVSDLDEFEEAADRMLEMNYNLVAADATGIAYRVGLDVPRRVDVSGDIAPWKAMDGSIPASLWTGEMLAREQIPRSRGLEQGWLATANTDPWGFTGDGAIDNDPWYYGSFFQAGYRGQRIEDELTRLTQRGDVTLQEMMDLQMDTQSIMADDVLPLLVDAYALMATDDSLAEFRGNADLDRVVQLMTEEWDLNMDRDSAGAVAWQVFMHNFSLLTLKDDISLAYDTAMGLMSVFVIKVAAMALQGEFPTGDMVLQEGRYWILLKSAANAADWIKGRYGSVDPSVGGYTFGDMKVISFDDAYGTGMPLFKVPADGGEDSLCVATNISFDESAAEWVTTYVSVERSVGTFTEDGTPEVWVNFPVGNHADPYSDDTIAANDDYIEGRYRKFLFLRHEVEAAVRERIALYP